MTEEIDFEDFLKTASDDDLRDCARMIDDEIRSRVNRKIRVNKVRLGRNMEAICKGLRGIEDGTVVIIDDIKRTRAVCRFPGDPSRPYSYKIPMSCLEPKG